AGGDGEQLRQENVATILSTTSWTIWCVAMLVMDMMYVGWVRSSAVHLSVQTCRVSRGGSHLVTVWSHAETGGCVLFDLRPYFDRDEASVDTEEDFLPSSMARYRQLLFAALKFCLAMLTSLGIENQDCGNQVMQFILSHGEVFHRILRDRQPRSLSLPALRELALTTAVLTRAN
ncbi:nuclear pore complex protein Nup205-like, partial [Saccostrea cucullata]|uniref:nuclear pore complex protein Nup205-like n=1 Tax=Saccostrea cuccullata TaxID=36930 RepID=UPI002ED5CFE1